MRRLGRYALRALAIVGALSLALIAYQIFFATPRDETKIRRTIEVVATSRNPAYCGSVMTPGYLRQTTGAPTRFAVDVCRQDAPFAGAASVAIDAVKIDGDRATATVVNRGGSFDGSWLVVRLAKTDDTWKLDRLLRFARFDRAGFDRAYRMLLRNDKTRPAAAACILAKTHRLTDAQLERLALNDLQAGFGAIATKCDRRGVEAGVVEALASPKLGFPPRAITCSKQRVEAFTDAELVALRFDLGSYGNLLFDCDADAVIDYTERDLKDRGTMSNGVIACVLDTLRRLPNSRAGSVIYEEAGFEALIDRCNDST